MLDGANTIRKEVLSFWASCKVVKIDTMDETLEDSSEDSSAYYVLVLCLVRPPNVTFCVRRGTVFPLFPADLYLAV